MNASGTASHHARRVADLVSRQGLHRRQVGGRRGPDELLAGGGGEERAPHRLLLDEVQEVGRVARELAAGGAAQLGAQAAPGGRAQAPVLLRIGRPQQRRGRLAHGVVDQQPAGGQLHERQLAQAGEGLGRGLVGQHRGEQREGRPARQRRGVQRAPRRPVETVEVDARQLLADRAGGDLLDRQARAVAQRPGGELEAQRVAVGDGVDAPRGLVVDAVAAQQLVGLLGRQVAERDRAQQRPVAAPALERRVAAADHDPHVGRQGREHHAAEPVVEHRQQLEGVEDQDHALAAGADRRGGLLDGGAAQRGQELALRGGDDVAVELEHDGAGLARLGREGVQERRLPDAGEAVDVGDDGPVGLEQPPQLGALALATGDRARLLREQGSERL